MSPSLARRSERAGGSGNFKRESGRPAVTERAVSPSNRSVSFSKVSTGIAINLCPTERRSNLAEKTYQEQVRNFRRGLVTNLDVLQSLTTFEESKRSQDKARFSMPARLCKSGSCSPLSVRLHPMRSWKRRSPNDTLRTLNPPPGLGLDDDGRTGSSLAPSRFVGWASARCPT